MVVQPQPCRGQPLGRTRRSGRPDQQATVTARNRPGPDGLAPGCMASRAGPSQSRDTEIDECGRRAMSREELEAEVLRLRSRHGEAGGEAFGRKLRSTPAGRDELFAAVEKTRVPMILTNPNLPDDPIVFANRPSRTSPVTMPTNCLAATAASCRDRAQTLPSPGHPDALAAKRDTAIDILNYKRDGTPFLNELFVSRSWIGMGMSSTISAARLMLRGTETPGGSSPPTSGVIGRSSTVPSISPSSLSIAMAGHRLERWRRADLRLDSRRDARAARRLHFHAGGS